MSFTCALFHVVTGEPARFFVQGTFPPSPILLLGDGDDVTLFKAQLKSINTFYVSDDVCVK